MIKITLNELYLMYITLLKLVDKELPVKLAWKIRKILLTIESDIKSFIEQKDKLFKKYDVKVENNNIKIDDEKKENFEKELNELLSIQTEIKQLEKEKIKLEELQNLNLSVIDLNRISLILEEK